jgi:hypothetical protein
MGYPGYLVSRMAHGDHGLSVECAIYHQPFDFASGDFHGLLVLVDLSPIRFSRKAGGRIDDMTDVQPGVKDMGKGHTEGNRVVGKIRQVGGIEDVLYFHPHGWLLGWALPRRRERLGAKTNTGSNRLRGLVRVIVGFEFVLVMPMMVLDIASRVTRGRRRVVDMVVGMPVFVRVVVRYIAMGVRVAVAMHMLMAVEILVLMAVIGRVHGALLSVVAGKRLVPEACGR